MRLLVGLHHLELGGSQLNALDLALSMREQGHEVALFGHYPDTPGPVAAMAEQAGLPVLAMRHRSQRLARTAPVRPGVARGLARAAQQHRADLIHVYEFSLGLDGFYGAHLRTGIPMVTTVYGMAVPRWLPRYGELIVGTRELVDVAAAFRARPTLIEPPVNTDADDPAVVDGQAFRVAHGIADDELMIGVVSRLEPDMKAEGILRAIGAVGVLADRRLRLVIVGDGPSYDDIAAEARRVNEILRRPAVVLTGAMGDPRPAYAAADIALGMGGSALRALAFGRPLVVLGIEGFSLHCAPDTIDYFLAAGFYGVGTSDRAAGATLADQVRHLAADASARTRIGAWGRQLVLDRFSLKAATQTLTEVYQRALAERVPTSRRWREGVRVAGYKAAADLMSSSARQRIRRVLG
ncbi:MAG TPA: glycosyltransferase family 4 protein [Micromonosporaceae bacterium]